MAATPQELLQPEDELAVHRLLQRYANACDTIAPAAVAALFGVDGELRVNGARYRGADIEAFYAARLDVATLHFVTGVSIDPVQDRTVRSSCGFLALKIPDDGWSATVGRYDDHIRIVAGRAEFVSREIHINGRRSLGGN